jgi:hypothetical protein
MDAMTSDRFVAGHPATPQEARELPRHAQLHRATSEALAIRFGLFELDEANARLLCDGRPVTPGPRSFAVLCELVRHPQALMTKNTLLDAVWGHRFVSESVLKGAISDLRAILQDDSKTPRYIETVAARLSLHRQNDGDRAAADNGGGIVARPRNTVGRRAPRRQARRFGADRTGLAARERWPPPDRLGRR